MKNDKRKRFDISRGIFPMSILVFMGMGFIWELWHPGWIVIVVACFIDEMIKTTRAGKLKISIYGLATIAFIVAGLAFNIWNYAWLIFVAAWVLDEMRIPSKGRGSKFTPNNNDSNKDNDIDDF